MSYGDGGVEDDAEAGEAASGDVGSDGSNNDVQSMVDTFSEFTTGNFNNTNFGGNSADTNVTVGSQKGSVTSKGGKYSSDFAKEAYDPTVNARAPSQFDKEARASYLSTMAQMNRAAAQQDGLAATPQDEDGLFGIFGGKTKAASDRANYGEFYQAGFDKNINPNASRSGLAPSMAVDIATNPFGRFSSTGEKVAAAAQMALPGGTIVGAARALGMMNTSSGGGKSGTTDEDNTTSTGLTRSTPKPLTRTQTNNNKTTLNVGPSRSTIRGYGRGTRKVY